MNNNPGLDKFNFFKVTLVKICVFEVFCCLKSENNKHITLTPDVPIPVLTLITPTFSRNNSKWGYKQFIFKNTQHPYFKGF